MLHGVSLKHVNNDAIQKAIADKAHPDTIAKLKANVAFNCITGFEYHEVGFEDLANLLSHDIGFNNFKFRDVSTAIYNKEKHPDATGLIRGVDNIASGCTWMYFDVDVTQVSDKEMHMIMRDINHHIARTSDPAKQYKYRVLLELDSSVVVSRDEWKYFSRSVASFIGIDKIDNLPMSQVIYGYKGREVLSVLNGKKVSPRIHLAYAKTKVAEQLEKEAEWTFNSDEAAAMLASPFSTFEFAYTAGVGDRWKTSMGAIGKAKKLGASKEYIKDLMYSINDFLDVPKARAIVEASLFSAI